MHVDCWISCRFVVDLAHILRFLLWCALSVLFVSWSCPTARRGSPVFLYRASQTAQYYITDYAFGTMYAEWLLPMAVDHRYCM